MKSYIFIVSENVLPFKYEHIYVRASEKAIRQRMYVGGFLRFLSTLYCEDSEITEIAGQPVMSLSQFDEWRKEHGCC